MTLPATQSCPLCRGTATRIPEGESARGRALYRCAACDLVTAARAQLPSSAAEAARYRSHENDPADPGYRAYLSRLVDSLVPMLARGEAGLDFGSGPVPALAALMAERGFPVAVWDPLFAPEPSPLSRRYDFITCTETAEHFHEPIDDFGRLASLLAPGGRLGVLTQPHDGATDFAFWPYARDLTHVSFYGARTFAWIAARFGWRLSSPRQDVAIFTAS